MATKGKTALFWMGCMRQFICFIPKAKGKGFIKHPFGGHESNDVSSEWMNIKPDIANGDTCDVDGIDLSIDLTMNNWDNGFKEGIEELKESLSKVFPHITDWREIDGDEFTEVATSH